jgi:hypothetical protein
MTNEIEKLHAKDDQIKKRIHEIQAQSNSTDRKQQSLRAPTRKSLCSHCAAFSVVISQRQRMWAQVDFSAPI